MRIVRMVVAAGLMCVGAQVEAQGPPLPVFAVVGGPFQAVNYGATAFFDGSFSYDTSLRPLTYSWIFSGISQSTCSTDALCSITTSSLGNTFAIYHGTFTVADNAGDQSSVPLQLTVLPVDGPVTTTPEPSSVALLGTGLFALVPLVHRRRA